MSYFSGPFKFSALFVMITAVLYLATVIFDGATLLIGIGVFYLLLMAALVTGRRFIGWIAFFVTGFGGCFALAQLWAVSGVPMLLWILIIAANWLAALGLFAALWRSDHFFGNAR